MARKTRQNSITSAESLKQINPENIQLLNEFLIYLRSVQRAEGTIAGYQNDINIFWCFLLERFGNKSFKSVTKRDIIAYQTWLIAEHENSPARVRRLKSAISSLSNYVENICDDDPEYEGFRSIVRKVDDPVNQPIRNKTVLTETQLQTLLDYLVENEKYKQACCVALAMCSGRRKSELVRFRVEDFDDRNLICDGAVYRTKEKLKTKGRGAGKFIFCYTLAEPFKKYFDLWMAERNRFCVESVWLFPDTKDPTKQMPASTLNSWAESFSKVIDVDFYFHALRHYTTTYLSKSGMPDSVIQKFIGWDSADMVGVYKDCNDEDEFAAFFKR